MLADADDDTIANFLNAFATHYHLRVKDSYTMEKAVCSMSYLINSRFVEMCKHFVEFEELHRKQIEQSGKEAQRLSARVRELEEAKRRLELEEADHER
jgi:hypothetical protein